MDTPDDFPGPRPMTQTRQAAWEELSLGKWEALSYELSAVVHAYFMAMVPVVAAITRSYNEAMRRINGHA